MASVSSRVMSQRDESTNSFFEALYKDKDAEAHEVMAGLFLGSCKAAQDRRSMQKRGVKYALIVHPGIPEPHPEHFKYCRAPLVDDPNANLLEVLPDALEFLGASLKKGRAFVFCMKGISRSSSVVIAYLMMDKGLGFQEAWKQCESKRPIVYPNIGFQQQLLHLESLLAAIPREEPFEKRLKLLRKAVPRGPLDAPESPLRVRDLIGDSMYAAFEEVEKLADKIFSQPQLLQKREQWKRHGLYFENMHKYKTLPSDIALIGRAKAVSTKLAGLPRVFADTLKGVKLATAVASQIQSWIVFAEPLLNKEEEKAAAEAAEGDEASDVTGEREGGDAEVPDWVTGFMKGVKDDGPKKKSKKQDKEGSESDSDPMAKKDKRKKDKKSKKEKKKEKKEKKRDKKNAKAVERAGKQASKIERLAAEAESAARQALGDAELAAEDADKMEKELSRQENRERDEEELAAADAAADAAAEARANFVKNIKGDGKDTSKRRGSSSGKSASSSSDSGSAAAQIAAHKRQRN